MQDSAASQRGPLGKAGAAAQKGPSRKGPQQEIEDRLREEVAIRKKEQQRHAEMLAKEEEDQQKFEALHKQLRGKEYGYDHKGQVRAPTKNTTSKLCTTVLHMSYSKTPCCRWICRQTSISDFA